MVLVGDYAKYYTVKGFLNKVTDIGAFVSKMSANYGRVGYGDLEEGQKKAWGDCYEVLNEALSELPEKWKEKLIIIFEYVLPNHAPWTKKFADEKHLRSDAILLSGDTVIVLEFKQMSKLFEKYCGQAGKYVRRLKRYHVGTQGMGIVPVLVLTKASGYRDIVDGVIVCSPDMLSDEIRKILGKSVNGGNAYRWIGSGFVFRKTADAGNVI